MLLLKTMKYFVRKMFFLLEDAVGTRMLTKLTVTSLLTMVLLVIFC